MTYIEIDVTFRLCLSCGKVCQGRKDKRYCSNACKQRAYRNRRRHGLASSL